MKNYYYRFFDENKNLIFDHTSDSPERLLKMVARESCDGSGATYCAWYFGHAETNIPENFFEEF